MSDPHADYDDVCHVYRGVHIPGCMGCAVYGHAGCTCPPRDRKTEIDRLHTRVAALEAKVAKLSRTTEGA